MVNIRIKTLYEETSNKVQGKNRQRPRLNFIKDE